MLQLSDNASLTPSQAIEWSIAMTHPKDIPLSGETMRDRGRCPEERLAKSSPTHGLPILRALSLKGGPSPILRAAGSEFGKWSWTETRAQDLDDDTILNFN